MFALGLAGTGGLLGPMVEEEARFGVELGLALGVELGLALGVELGLALRVVAPGLDATLGLAVTGGLEGPMAEDDEGRETEVGVESRAALEADIGVVSNKDRSSIDFPSKTT